jgi:Carboxypeptidase regulatory-like domain/TonB-dependent Receptor Plug Domain
MQSTIRLVAKLSCLALVIALVAGMAFAQTTKGTIAGIVTDNTDAVITGATVTATAAGGGETRTVTTGANGEYRIEALTPGEFTITVSAPGFGKKNITNVVVRTSMITSNHVQLAIASASEVVSVEATTDAIQTESGELSKNIPVVEVKDLPYISLNPYSLAVTLPGVSTVASRDSQTNGTSFSVNGLRPRSNNFLLDGFDNNDNDIAGQAFQPNNIESVQEVAVLTNSYSAEFGRGGGSVSNLTFRSGSNAFHGAAWEQYSGSRLNALTSEDSKLNGLTRPPQFVNNIFGFRVGGPVIKNKLFFFGSSQWNRFYGAQGAPTLFVPTAAGLSTLQNIATNNPGAATQANVLLRSLKGITGKPGPDGFLADAGLRTGCTPTVDPQSGGTVYCPVEIGTFIRTDEAASLSREWTARADYMGTNDSIFVRYTDSMGSLSPDLFANAGALPSNDTQQGGPSRLLGAMWAHTFSPKVLNEFRFSAQQIDFKFGLTPATAANPDSVLPSLALFDSIGPSFGGPTSGLPQGRGHKTFQFQDSLSWTRGTHVMKLGADLAVLLVQDLAPFNPAAPSRSPPAGPAAQTWRPTLRSIAAT